MDVLRSVPAVHAAPTPPSTVVLSVAEDLQGSATPRCEAFIEMLRAFDANAKPRFVNTAVAELLSEPMTEAEATAAKILASLMTQVRDTQVDDEAVLQLSTFMTSLIARFESYVTERNAPDA